MLHDEDIREALKACFAVAPGGMEPVNVVDLGCVQRVSLEVDREAPGYGIAGVPPRQRLRLELLACAADDDAQAQMRAQVENRLAGLPGLSSSEVVVVDEPVWTAARMTAAGRAAVGAGLFSILNNKRRR